MTFDGIRRLSPYWSLALCYGVVTAVGLIPGLLYGNEFAYWLLGFWLILPVSALLCTFRAAYRALPRYGLMPVFVGLWAIVLPLATFRSTEMQSLFLRACSLAGRLNAGRTGAQICILVSKQIETLLRTLLRCGL